MFEIADILKPPKHEVDARSFEIEITGAAKDFGDLVVVTADAIKTRESEIDSEIQRFASDKKSKALKRLYADLRLLDTQSASKSTVYLSISGNDLGRIAQFEERAGFIAKTLRGHRAMRGILNCGNQSESENKYAVMSYYDFR